MVKKDYIVLPADPSDDEDFDVTAEGLERGLRARFVRMSRQKLGLTQAEFSRRFRIPVGTLRDWEQARVTPPEYAIGYIRLIVSDPGTSEAIIADKAAEKPVKPTRPTVARVD